jgi:hypothetical protein
LIAIAPSKTFQWARHKMTARKTIDLPDREFFT